MRTADGQDQAISGNPYYDTLSVSVIDDRTVFRNAKKGGKTVIETKNFVSADGKTMHVRFDDTQGHVGVLSFSVQ